MTALERLADLRTNLEHLRGILRSRQVDEASLAADRSLHNDVLFSLLMVCQAVIDIAGEIAGRHGLRFQDYTEAIRALRQVEGFTPELVRALEPLPGFRNVLIHEYTQVDHGRVLDALGKLDAVREFMQASVEVLERLDGAQAPAEEAT